MAKKLFRSKQDRWVAGVCGGMGKYFGTDPNAIRALWAIVTVLSGVGPGLLAYIVAWIIIPEK